LISCVPLRQSSTGWVLGAVPNCIERGTLPSRCTARAAAIRSRLFRESAMSDETPRGTKQMIDGRMRVFYDGYWIKAYEAPGDSLLAKKQLIEALTRRLFNHVEHGLNMPGRRLDEARRAFESETDPDRKRVKGGMLAGALFNRAADVFTKL